MLALGVTVGAEIRPYPLIDACSSTSSLSYWTMTAPHHPRLRATAALHTNNDRPSILPSFHPSILPSSHPSTPLVLKTLSEVLIDVRGIHANRFKNDLRGYLFANRKVIGVLDSLGCTEWIRESRS